MGRLLAEQPLTTATAGKSLTENDLRQAAHCLEKYFFGQSYKWPEELAAAKYLVEKTLAHRIRKGEHNLDFWKSKYLVEAMKTTSFYVPDEILESPEARDVLLFASEIERFFKDYTPVWPPDRMELNISKSLVSVDISGVFLSEKNKTLHILDITPYPSSFDMRNDPVTVIKIAALRDFVKKHHSGRPQVVIHQFGKNVSKSITYKNFSSTTATKPELERVVNIVRALEAGIHFPSVPCPEYSCPFRQQCFKSED